MVQHVSKPWLNAAAMMIKQRAIEQVDLCILVESKLALYRYYWAGYLLFVCFRYNYDTRWKSPKTKEKTSRSKNPNTCHSLYTCVARSRSYLHCNLCNSVHVI
jgi:hypothetical protein